MGEARLRAYSFNFKGAPIFIESIINASTYFQKLDILQVEKLVHSMLRGGGCQSLFSKSEYINLHVYLS